MAHGYALSQSYLFATSLLQVSILLKKNNNLDPGSHSALMVMESPPLVRVRELVNKLAEPRLPVDASFCPQRRLSYPVMQGLSCRMFNKSVRDKTSGMGRGQFTNLCIELGMLGKNISVLHPPSFFLDICVLPLLFSFKQPRHRFGKVASRSGLVAVLIHGQLLIK